LGVRLRPHGAEDKGRSQPGDERNEDFHGWAIL
jgi:hypothetical protein